MKKEEKALLRMKDLISGLTPEKKSLTVGCVFRNADSTGDDDPQVGSSWKEYWQIFTKDEFPTTCPFCGKPLADDDVSGCHINIRRFKLFPQEGEDKYYYDNKKYIIPGRQNCNLKVKDGFTTKVSVIAVEAIKK